MDITEVLDPPQRGFQELCVPQGASAVAVATASPSLPAIDRPSRNDFENETLAQQRASTLRLCEETVALLALPVWSSFGCAPLHLFKSTNVHRPRQRSRIQPRSYHIKLHHRGLRVNTCGCFTGAAPPSLQQGRHSVRAFATMG